MSKKRVLFISQEMQPYTAISEISEIVRKLPQYVQTKGLEIRILMPRFGTINERRHRLHEVVRLSGMNIIVNDEDYPLIIKVASLPGARMQVYFLDNEDFFKRKSVFENDEGQPFEDNEDRMIFFCKGVIETVKKFGWAPNIVHCHGWMTSLVPVYLKTAYKNEPIFKDSSIVYSAYDNYMEEHFSSDFIEKASINNLENEDLANYLEDGAIKLDKGAISFADAIVKGSDTLRADVEKMFEETEKPVLNYNSIETVQESTLEFYQSLMVDDEEEVEDGE